MDTALELKAVTKVFGKVRAVDQIDLRVPRGGMYGIIGPIKQLAMEYTGRDEQSERAAAGGLDWLAVLPRH